MRNYIALACMVICRFAFRLTERGAREAEV